MAKDHLEVYSKNCLRCAHLVEGVTRQFDACHHTAGNNECPASEVRIIPTGKVRRTVRLIREARADQDALAEAKILQAVAEESAAFKQLLYREIS